MFKRSRRAGAPEGAIETLLGPTTRVQGDVEFSGGLHLDGHIAGNVRAVGEAVSVLTVSEAARIEGSVDVAHVVLNGLVQGDIVARNRIELGAKARVNGSVYYGVIEMAMGAEITGKLVHVPATG